MRKSFLIPTQVNDTHAASVALSLTSLGQDVVRWFGADFPARQQISVRQSNEHGTTVAVGGPGISLDTSRDAFDLVWLRRPCPPALPEWIHPEDYDFALKENYKLFATMWWHVAPEAAWVNPFESYRRSNSKLCQLAEASAAGLRIPRTLTSNSYDDIRSFIEGQPGAQAIFKPQRIMQWGDGTAGTRVSRAVRIGARDIDRDPRVVTAAPGIYQELIRKRFEVRVTCFGDEAIAARIATRDGIDYGIDWRSVPGARLALEPIDLPPAVHAGCIAVMRGLGIRFGCFDFIVDEGSEWVFLEVNEMGQFLWIEAVNPEIPMLQSFVNFLLAEAGSDVRATGLSYASLSHSGQVQRELLSDLEHHARRSKLASLCDVI